MKRNGLRILTACLLGAAGAGCSKSAVPPTPGIPATGSVAAEVVETKEAFNGALEDYARLVQQFFRVVVVCHDDTHVLVLRGPSEDVQSAVKMIEKLESIPTREELIPPKAYMVKLQRARAEEVAKVLQNMIEKGFFDAEKDSTEPPVSVVVVPMNNAIWIGTNIRYEDRIRGIIDELDRSLEPSTQPQQEIRIINGNLVPQSRP